MTRHQGIPDREITGPSLKAAGSSFIGAMFSGMAIARSALAVFMQPISYELKWGRAEIGAASTFLQWGMALCMLFGGRYVDRWGPRAVLLPLTLVSGLLVMSVSMTGGSLLLFYALYALIGASQMGIAAYGKLLSGWFYRHRGLALAGLGIGVLLSFTVTPRVALLLVNRVGWRSSYQVLGASILLVAFPILFAFFRERPGQASGLASQNSAELDPDGAPPISTLQAFRMKTYWLMVGAQVGTGFAFAAVTVHSIGIMTSHGMTRDFGVLALSIVGASGLAAQALIGFLLDRIDTPKIIVPFALSLLGIVAIHIGSGKPALLIGSLLFGLGCGGETSMNSYFVTRFFGVRNFSQIYRSLMPILILSGAPGPIVAGLIFDRTGSYAWAMVMMEITLALAVLCFALLGDYPFPSVEIRQQRRRSRTTLKAV
jgi:MFS family permease